MGWENWEDLLEEDNKNECSLGPDESAAILILAVPCWTWDNVLSPLGCDLCVTGLVMLFLKTFSHSNKVCFLKPRG